MSTLAIGYGTYGMQHEDVFTAVPRLARIGYASVEICALTGWPTAPAVFGAADRARLVATMKADRLQRPVVLGHLAPLAAGEERRRMLAEYRACLRLAADLAYGDEPPVFTTVLGGDLPPWAMGRDAILAGIHELAALAAAEGVVLALEPHVGGMFDTPEKAVWLVEAAASPHVRLNFDVSHFVAQGLPVPPAIAACLPHAVHIHIKDVVRSGGSFTFALPGHGGFAYADFFSRLVAAGSAIPVVVEVSGHVWRKPGYDAWAAAEEVFAFLAEERRGMEVLRADRWQVPPECRGVRA